MAETPILTQYPKVRTPFLQKVGGRNKQLLFSTIADQVAFDNTNVDAELRRLKALAGGTTDARIYNTWAEMQADRTIRANLIGRVIDASDGPDVTSGGASYIHDGEKWLFIGPLGASVAQVNWNDIQQRPLSPVRDIDDAVDKRHEHDNQSVIDEFEETADGKLNWKGKPIVGEDETVETMHFDTYPTPEQLKKLKVGGQFTVGDGPITGLVSAGSGTLDSEAQILLADFQEQLTRLASRVTQIELDHIRNPDGVDPEVIGQAVRDYLAANPLDVDMDKVNDAISTAIADNNRSNLRSDNAGFARISIQDA